uniref:Reverse transcriptase domain-containing protein n=1 Tax=Caenorhabditis japonica TaxID=281687 RepID=A0A8R1EF31_CAEJA
MIRSERITESNTPWTSPIVLVKKKSGALRVCLDFRRLNDITIPDNFPLPRIDAILEKVGGARYFSSLDMANGYLQLRLDAESSYKCGFITETKVFAYTHLPFGLKSAASYFQRALKTVLANMDRDVLVYIDDILIYSQDFGQHIATLRNVFERFRQFNLKVSPKKCEFLKKAITFLGHTITESNYTPNEANVKSIAEMSTPKNLAETRRFVGMVGFFRKFLPNLATVAEPLTRLNRKNEKFRWETPQQEAFDTLREALLDKPILAFPDYEKPFHLFCDASAVGLGAALMQAETEEEKHFKAIAYTSRTLADSETRWPAIQVELLAIIFALRHFRPYICLSKIILHSDHRPLSYLLSKHKVNDNLARWLI